MSLDFFAAVAYLRVMLAWTYQARGHP
jgi:hypothetical protein